MSEPVNTTVTLRTARDHPIRPRGRLAPRMFTPSSDAGGFSRRIAGRWLRGPMLAGPLDMALLERGDVTSSVQVHNRFSIGVSLAMRPGVVVPGRAASPLPAARLEPVVVRWRPPGASTEAGLSRREPAALSQTAVLIRPAMRLRTLIETERLRQRIFERDQKSTTERLMTQLLDRTRRTEVIALQRVETAHAGLRQGGPLSAPTIEPLRMVVQKSVLPVPPPVISSGSDRPAAVHDRVLTPAIAPAPPQNLRQLADEVLAVIDRRLTASRERVQRR